MTKVMVEVVAEQMSYSYLSEDGITHTRESYVRGQKFAMEEEDAKKAAEGFVSGPAVEMVNGMGTPVLVYPPKPEGMARAAVKILGHVGEAAAAVKPSAPVQKDRITPAPEPKAGPR